MLFTGTVIRQRHIKFDLQLDKHKHLHCLVIPTWKNFAVLRFGKTHQWSEKILVEFVVSNVVAVDVLEDRIHLLGTKEADAKRRSLWSKGSQISTDIHQNVVKQTKENHGIVVQTLTE